MSSNKQVGILLMFIVIIIVLEEVSSLSQEQKRRLREKVIEMFDHGYNSYMMFAYPADELMPLSCAGRYRDTAPSRGDIDDSLGNFALTLIDTLDTLAVLGKLEEFEKAIKLVIRDVKFDTDIVVSVFETNIRVLGGLLGAHVMAKDLKRKQGILHWYNNELLDMAKDIGYRLLPAFNTNTGIPYPRVNLKYGLCKVNSRTGRERDTCTACAGTMILEFAALSRLTGESIFEEKAHKAMEFLWQQRHRSSDLVGTVINIHNGDWVRRESGVGAGIDSYYEYLLKAYILLGDDTYLERFNRHYSAVMKYVNQGPLLVDVHMHRPDRNSRNFMDALLAFWPGLQVLKGDIKPAIEIHEMLYQVTQRHNFLPEAFTTDFRVHWGQHPLRPEFVESTYFLYKATNDPHYLEVGESVLNNLEKHARVPCGFAAIKDVRAGTHEDQMDSFVLAETFKYLYLLFTEPEDLVINIDDFVFTTEAHLLPLYLSMQNYTVNTTSKVTVMPQMASDEDENFERSCKNIHHQFRGKLRYFAENVRNLMKNYVEKLCPKPKLQRTRRLRGAEFIAGNSKHLAVLKDFGIRLATMTDGRVQLLHTASEAASPEDAEEGMLFMQEMIELSNAQQQEAQQDPRVVQLMSEPYVGMTWFSAGPAQFGYDLKKSATGVQGEIFQATPFNGCSPFQNAAMIAGRIAIVERGGCMFVEKARNIEQAGGIGGIVLDNNLDSTSQNSPMFAMSGDGTTDVTIPLLFLFRKEGEQLLDALKLHADLKVLLAAGPKTQDAIAKSDATSHTPSEQIQRMLVKGVDSNLVGLLESDINGNIKYDFSLTVGDMSYELKVAHSTNSDIDTDIASSDSSKAEFDFKDLNGVRTYYSSYFGTIPVTPATGKPEEEYVYKAMEHILSSIYEFSQNHKFGALEPVRVKHLSEIDVQQYATAMSKYIEYACSDTENAVEDQYKMILESLPFSIIATSAETALKDNEKPNMGKEDNGHRAEHYATETDFLEIPSGPNSNEKLIEPESNYEIKIAPPWMQLSPGDIHIDGKTKTLYVHKDAYTKHKLQLYKKQGQSSNMGQDDNFNLNNNQVADTNGISDSDAIMEYEVFHENVLEPLQKVLDNVIKNAESHQEVFDSVSESAEKILQSLSQDEIEIRTDSGGEEPGGEEPGGYTETRSDFVLSENNVNEERTREIDLDRTLRSDDGKYKKVTDEL